MEPVVPVLLTLAALIHVPPLWGARGGLALQRLYGVDAEDANVRVMLRHRAVLFVPVVATLLRAAWDPAERPFAMALGVLSAGSYLVLCSGEKALNARMQRVFRADVVATACLLAAAMLHAWNAR